MTNANVFPQNGIPLQSLPESGTPPEHRLKSALDAQTLVSTLWEASLPRNAKNAAIQGQLDGNPPYSPSKLRAQGRASDPNFNTLEAQALVNTAMVPYYDLFAGADHYVDIKLDYGDEKNKILWSEIVTDEYDRMLKRWANFDYVNQQMLNDFVVFGKGFLMWEDSRSWHAKRIAYHRALVPDKTSIDLEKLSLVVIVQDWEVHELYAKIKNRKAATEVGWNVDETIRAIADAVPRDPQVPVDPVAVQQMLKDNDIYVSATSSTVGTATILVREFDGEWSEVMVRRYQVPTTTTQQPEIQFMYEKRKKYKNILDAFVPFFFNVLNGSWNGASGLGKDIFTPMQLKDRLACTQANAVFLRNSLVLQPRQALDKSRMNLLQVGAVTWIPENVDVHQGTIMGDIASTIEVSREISSMIEKNTGIYRPSMERGGGNPETLGEFQAKFAQATVLSVSAVNRLYAQYDRFYQAQWARVINPSADGDDEAAKEARLFLKRCKDRGVPEEAFEKLDYIRAWRNIGNGSIAARQQTLANFMSIFPMLKTNGQEALLRDIITTSGSLNQTERYMPQSDWNGIPNDQTELALLENAALKIGAPVIWTPSQNNIIHIQTHLEAGSQAASSLEAGANPAEVLGFLDGIGQHTLIHLQRESQNPTTKDAVKVLATQWKQLAQFTDQLRNRVKGMMEQQSEQADKTQQVMSDAQLKQFETQGKLMLSRDKAQATMALKAERQQADIALKDASTAAEIERQNAKAFSQIQQERALAKSKPNG